MAVKFPLPSRLASVLLPAAVDDTTLNCVPAKLRSVPALYVVLVSVPLIEKLGYVPETFTLPVPDKLTVWSGAVFVNVIVSPE